MDMQLENFIDKCRCCLDEISAEKVEIGIYIDMKFYEMTQMNLVTSDLLPSYVCYDCYEILNSYSEVRSKFIENQQKLEQLITNTDNNVLTEDENSVIEYEEVEMREDEIDQIIVEENPQSTEVEEYDEQDSEESEEDEELRLEDIVKPEFLHYCLPKKKPEPVKKVFHIPRQLEKKKHKLEEILKEQVSQEAKTRSVCQECGKYFTNSVLLEQHVSKVHRKFLCEFDDCAKIFVSQFQLNKHRNTQHKDSLFECTYCDKSFSQKLHLKNHLYTHNQS